MTQVSYSFLYLNDSEVFIHDVISPHVCSTEVSSTKKSPFYGHQDS